MKIDNDQIRQAILYGIGGAAAGALALQMAPALVPMACAVAAGYVGWGRYAAVEKPTKAVADEQVLCKNGAWHNFGNDMAAPCSRCNLTMEQLVFKLAKEA